MATLDTLSGGRFLFGVGAGWNREEMRDHGTDPARRFSIMRERVEAMKAIWTQDEAEYHGEHVDFGPMWSWPKPVQKPHPPVLLGGVGEHVLGARIAELRERAARELPVTVFGAKPTARALERLAGAGVTRALLILPPAEPAEVERGLDEYAALLG